MADFDALIKQAELDERTIAKPAMLEVRGTRRPVAVFIGESKAPFLGHVVEGPDGVRLVHDYRVMNKSVTHVARLVPDGSGAFSIRSEFINVRQDPTFNVAFFGDLEKTEEGYAGAVTVSRPGYESTQSWSVEYED